jgi:hypothetical protein
MIKNMYCSSCKVPIISCHISETNCVDSFFLNTQVSKIDENRQVVAELLFHMGGRADGDVKVIVYFRNSANAPRNKIIRPVYCFVLIYINTYIPSSGVFAVGYELNL